MCFACLVVDEVQEFTNVESARCRAIASLCTEHRWGLSGTMFTEPTPECILGYYLIIDDRTIPRCLPDTIKHISSAEFPGVSVTMVSRQRNEAFIPPEVRKIIVSHRMTPEETQMYLPIKTVTKEISKRLIRTDRRRDDRPFTEQPHFTYLRRRIGEV